MPTAIYKAVEVSGRFDLIVSNPPYIRDQDPHLPALVHEPLPALTAGPDGLADLRLIVQQAPAHRRWLALWRLPLLSP